MKLITALGNRAFSAIFTPSVTWLMMICALWSNDNWLCGFTLDWFSVKKTGLLIFPMS